MRVFRREIASSMNEAATMSSLQTLFCCRDRRIDVVDRIEWIVKEYAVNQSTSWEGVVVVMREEVWLGFVEKSLSNGAVLDVESPR